MHLLLIAGGETSWELWGVSVRGCEKGLKGYGLVWGNWGEGLWKWVSALDWMLLGSGADPMVGRLNQSYMEDRAKDVGDKEAEVTL